MIKKNKENKKLGKLIVHKICMSQSEHKKEIFAPNTFWRRDFFVTIFLQNLICQGR